jgi:hypothetical protein
MARLSGRYSGRTVRFGNRRAPAGDAEEGRFCANAILCFIGWIPVVMGVWYLQAESTRAPKVHTYNDAVREWNVTHRAEFEAANFRIEFAQCATCAPHLTLDLASSEAQAEFGREERGRQGPNPDVSQSVPLQHSDILVPCRCALISEHFWCRLKHVLPWRAQSIRYRPLYFRSRRVEAVELVPDGVAVSNPMQQPVHVTVEVSTSGGRKSTLTAPATLEPYKVEAGSGNEKVCRNQHGEYSSNTCYYRWFLRAMCFSVTPIPGSNGMEWEFDPETPRAGCDVYDDWSYAQYAKDTRRDDLYEQGRFSFAVSVRHGDDPIEIARDQTHLQLPDFGESPEDLRLEGWASLGFGLMLLAAPSFQVSETIEW